MQWCSDSTQRFPLVICCPLWFWRSLWIVVPFLLIGPESFRFKGCCIKDNFSSATFHPRNQQVFPHQKSAWAPVAFLHNNQLFEMNCWWTCSGNFTPIKCYLKCEAIFRETLHRPKTWVLACEDVCMLGRVWFNNRVTFRSAGESPVRTPGFVRHKRQQRDPGQFGVSGCMIHPSVWSIKTHFCVPVMSTFQRWCNVITKVRLAYWFVERTE